MSTMEESHVNGKSDKDGLESKAGQVERSSDIDEKRECDAENERMAEKKGDGDGDVDGEEKRCGSDGEEKREVVGEEEEEPPSEIFHSSLATLSSEIDEFVVKAGEMWVERQRKEKEENQKKRDDEIKRKNENEKNDVEEGKEDANVYETTDPADKPANADQAAAEETDVKEMENDTEETNEADEAALEVPDFVDNFASLVEAKIVNYEYGEGTAKWRHEEGAEPPFFENVDRLHKLANALSLLGRSEPNYAESFNRVSSVLHKAMLFTNGSLNQAWKTYAMLIPIRMHPRRGRKLQMNPQIMRMHSQATLPNRYLI